ncbi:hypothetical protein pCPXV0029 [Cowpox virus]|uniref:Uncharacterized protein n=1 Tax=Cowpox virus TaxID=10243 RepID=A0A0K2YSR4_COWPX|nr:hypothetical protein pCPXV0029 [Cowpox virus]SNB49465.1 hypothetical protein pCPXV0029 [Cowpox virus]
MKYASESDPGVIPNCSIVLLNNTGILTAAICKLSDEFTHELIYFVLDVILLMNVILSLIT